jgi:hypothetical protein
MIYSTKRCGTRKLFQQGLVMPARYGGPDSKLAWLRRVGCHDSLNHELRTECMTRFPPPHNARFSITKHTPSSERHFYAQLLSQKLFQIMVSTAVLPYRDFFEQGIALVCNSRMTM